MPDLARTGPDLPWFTDELQHDLIEACRTGLKPKWAALLCNVAPKALGGILDLGSRRDAAEPFRGFVRRWTKVEAELMRDKVVEWRDGNSSAFAFLKDRWPKVWGPDAEPDYEALSATVTNAEEEEQFEQILADPEAFGVEHLFTKHGWVRQLR